VERQPQPTTEVTYGVVGGRRAGMAGHDRGSGNTRGTGQVGEIGTTWSRTSGRLVTGRRGRGGSLPLLIDWSPCVKERKRERRLAE
jgi:hypothetical protein